MTREEAIQVMKAYRDKLINSASNQLDGDIEAFDIAIKSLEQSPCEQIKWERDTAIAQFKELGYGLGEKPKTGHWKPTIVRGSESYICSECLAECCYVTTNYCPNCGAKMESEG